MRYQASGTHDRFHSQWTPTRGLDARVLPSSYIDVIKETGTGDVQYASKSSIYQAAVAMLYEGTSPPGLVNKVLERIPAFFGFDLDYFTIRLGRGWPSAEGYLKTEIAAMINPESLSTSPSSP